VVVADGDLGEAGVIGACGAFGPGYHRLALHRGHVVAVAGILRWKAALGALLTLVVCGGGAPERPDVLLFTIDTLRADHLGAYGYGRPTSPGIDALAAEGTLFEIAYAPMGTTCPSHATLFTSRHPLAHGVVRNGLPLLEDETTLAEVMEANGYATAAFVSSYPVSHRLGFAQGFEHYDDDFEGARLALTRKWWAGQRVDGSFERVGGETAGAVTAWLAVRRDSRPLFLWVHLFDPHAPHLAPPQIRALLHAQEPSAPSPLHAGYDAEIRYTDEQVQRIVGAFEAVAKRPPLVVLTSDHGEGLLDHGWPIHNRYLYEEEVRVPLIFRWKERIPAGLRLAQPAHLVDLLPTLVSLLELDPSNDAPEDSDGIDLSPFFARREPPEPDPERILWLQRPYYAGAVHRPPGSPELVTDGYGFGLRMGRWKYMEVPKVGSRELYDLENDRQERRDLASVREDHAKQLSAHLADWSRRQLASARARDEEVAPEDLEALRALGYAE
jgi:arylsulfatase A-like enzyme